MGITASCAVVPSCARLGQGASAERLCSIPDEAAAGNASSAVPSAEAVATRRGTQGASNNTTVVTLATDGHLPPEREAPPEVSDRSQASAASSARSSSYAATESSIGAEEEYGGSSDEEGTEHGSGSSVGSFEPSEPLRQLLEDNLLDRGEAAALAAELDSLDDLAVAAAFAAARRRLPATGTRPQRLQQPRRLRWSRKRAPTLRHPASVTDMVGSSSRDIPAAWWREGLSLIAARKVCAVLVVSNGGDVGSMHDVTDELELPSRASMLQLLAERLRRLQHLASRRQALDAAGSAAQRSFRGPCLLPLYLVVSPDIRPRVEQHLRKHSHFGLDPAWVHVLAQPLEPVLNASGHLLLAAPGRLAKAPAGCGALFAQLQLDGCLEGMRRSGIQHAFVTDTSNLLAKIADPSLFGFASALGAGCVLKVVDRLSGDDPLGIFCAAFGDRESVLKAPHATVRQMEEMHAEQRYWKAPDGGPRFRAGDLRQYVFRADFLARVASLPRPFAPPHLCEVALRAFDARTRRYKDFGVSASSGGGVKAALAARSVGQGEADVAYRLEALAADAFVCADHIPGLRVDRVQELDAGSAGAPRGSGEDPRVAALCALHRGWIEAAGGTFRSAAEAFGDGSRVSARTGCCEVSPLVSYGGEDLSGHFREPLDLPLYIAAASGGDYGAVAAKCEEDEELPPTPPDGDG
eukprot:TRINITY_DN19861_c0_g1_i1.p1 TRINITY_DN19861_c0_g1~~TRINITY_DN19861_c0_g1_i1.p1  ORF type:complete len:693 (+),score=156.86 TRINITY_DN19861_c0_g1_i1:162-2240(+)